MNITSISKATLCLTVLSLCLASCNRQDDSVISSAPMTTTSSEAKKQDVSTVQFLRASDEALGKKYQILTKTYEKYDPGFAKVLLLYETLPGDPPNCFKIKRFAQYNPEGFVDLECGPSSKELLHFRITKQLLCFCLSSRGFLPGEKVVIRLESIDPDVFEELSYYPRPLMIKDESGKILLEATLASIFPTIYSISFPDIPAEEEYEYSTINGMETHHFTMQNATKTVYIPGVNGRTSGFGGIELKFKDGTIYNLQLPWGDECIRYLNGER